MSTTDIWSLVPKARRIVVKIGSSTLTRNGQLRPDKFTALARDVSGLIESGRQVVVVSSGAIAIGAHRLGWGHAGESILEKQAAAAVGASSSEARQAAAPELARRIHELIVTDSTVM